MLSTPMLVSQRARIFLGFVLLATMWLTRSHHFATLSSLPDASWATFFIAGLCSARWLVPTLLLINAGSIDYLAIHGGVSDYCVTPAYPFLIPAYLTLWAAGRWAAFGLELNLRGLIRGGVALIVGVAGAFLISNVSFFLFAGYFDSMPALVYSRRVAGYFFNFLESTAAYTVVSLVVLLLCGPRAVSSSPHVPRETQ